MAAGIDVPADIRSAADCLLAAQYEFVGRYYAFHTQIPGKILTRPEAEALSALGLNIVAVWENGPADTVPYFTRERGLTDGAGAHQCAAGVVGQPVGTPIYFAVDCDPSSTELAAGVTAYFQGVADALANSAGGSPDYQIGVYGSGLTCSTLIGAGLATTGWLASATGWRGYADYASWSIKQGAESRLCGVLADSNVTQGPYGGFQVPAPTLVATAGSVAKGIGATAASPVFFPTGIESIQIEFASRDGGGSWSLTVAGPKRG